MEDICFLTLCFAINFLALFSHRVIDKFMFSVTNLVMLSKLFISVC